ncbi:hypothetical protein J2Y86_005900 [Pseudomonas migulae]|uniref:DUF86 domain-containing protein n=1 Tax=Pseudomonas migulae TaxID=78543 RepID=UPI0020A11134|nr:DUF86 domain-containing protein [Pseudomonas migulae]MCP1501193.1 hypothetical protein [Pseudomonas migulae]
MKRNSIVFLRYFISCMIVLGWVLLGWNIPIINLSENQALYTFSSQAQVVAAVYGLTITGYIFLHNQQDRLADKDETVADALDEIKIFQHSFITFLTLVSLAAIFCALFAIIFRESPYSTLKVVTQNSAAAFFFIALVCTGYFVRDAMKPNKIEEASDRIKKEVETRSKSDNDAASSMPGDQVSVPVEEPPFLEPTPVGLEDFVGERQAGDANFSASSSFKISGFEQFLSSYNRIERSLDVFASIYLDRTTLSIHDLSRYPVFQENKSSPRSKWTKSRIVKAMLSQKLISSEFANNLSELIRYRNALVHGRDFSVSVDILDRVQKAADELERIMHKIDSY